MASEFITKYSGHPMASLGDVAAYTELDSGTSAVLHTLTGKRRIKVMAGDYDVRLRALTSEDTDPCTASNAQQRVAAGSYEYFGLPVGATGLSLLALGDGKTTIIEY